LHLEKFGLSLFRAYLHLLTKYIFASISIGKSYSKQRIVPKYNLWVEVTIIEHLN
jgi:hypothetical protein